MKTKIKKTIIVSLLALFLLFLCFSNLVPVSADEQKNWVFDAAGNYTVGSDVEVTDGKAQLKQNATPGTDWITAGSTDGNPAKDWAYRHKIEIDNSQAEYDVANYQVKIELDENNFDFAKADSQGSDIRITGARDRSNYATEEERLDAQAEEEIDYWIETSSYSQAGKTGTIWAKVPSVYSYYTDTTENSGTDNKVKVDDVSGFPTPADFPSGEVPCTIKDDNNTETNYITDINVGAKELTFKTNLAHDYLVADNAQVRYFEEDSIYLYYGNSNASSSTADGDNVFEFFDTGNETSDWTLAGSAGQDAGFGNPAPSYKTAQAGGNYMYQDVGLVPNRILELDIRPSTVCSDMSFLVNSSGLGQNFRVETRGGNFSGFGLTNNWSAGGAPSCTCSNFAADTWHEVKIIIGPTSASGYIDDTICCASYNFANNGGYIGLQYGNYWDNIKVRKYVSTEPTLSLQPSQSLYSAVWQYRRAVTIDNSGGGALTDYQVKIDNLDTATLIAAGKMKDSCFDIRLTNSDGTTEIPYWIESGTCDTADTEIWVKVPSIDAGDSSKMIYMYYGNEGMGSGSNGDNVFEFFDTGNETSDWTLAGSAGQDAGFGNPAPSYKTAQAGGNYMYQDVGLVPNRILELDIRPSTVCSDMSFLVNSSGLGQNFRVETRGGCFSGFGLTNNWAVSGVPSCTCSNFAADTWHEVKIIIGPTSASGYIDDTICCASYNFANNGGYIGLQYGNYWDNIKVRKYFSPEPSILTGAESDLGWAQDFGSLAKVAVVNNTGEDYASLVSFIEVLGSENQGSVKYQISDSSKTGPWYWYDAGQSKWVAASGLLQTNIGAEVGSEISDFMEDIGKSGQTGSFFFKAFLVSDGSQAVELDSLTLTYVYDTYAPANPSSPTMLAGSTQLTSDTWYNHKDGLRFTWPAACAAGVDCGTGGAKDLQKPGTGEGTSGVAGYDVYWGTNSSADPATAGAYQVDSGAGNSFVVADLTDSDSGNTYYLRMRTKDEAGNISDAETLFIYKFELYLNDTTPPLDPTDLELTVDSQELQTNTWYNYQEDLVFTWPKACDPEVDCNTGGAKDLLPAPNPDNEGTLGLDGYWVYFGANSTADPVTEGAYQAEDTAGNSYELAAVPASLSGETVYFRIRTKDQAGNLSAAADTLFLYKFDITQPNPPSSLSHVPLGYTPTNEFTFIWEASADEESGFQGYCYKTGASDFTSDAVCNDDGKFTEDTSIATAEDSQVKAYQEGQNIFYVRSLDEVGNFSDWLSDIYYFAGEAPLEPQNLKVSPTSSEAKPAAKNEFSFAWTAPLSYSSPIAGYYYSLNTLPSEYTATFTTDTSLSSTSFATQQGKNTFYLVAKDEAGNVNWTNYASVDFYCETKAPGPPRDPTITDASIRAKEQYAITLMWTEPQEAGSGIDQYILERAEKKAEDVPGSTPITAAASLTFTQIAQVPSTSTGYLDTNLDTNQVYYYQVKAQDNAQAVSRASEQVGMRPEGRYTSPPEISEIKLEPRSFGAQVSWKTDRPADSHIQYGKKSVEESEEGIAELVEEHEVLLRGLDPETTYLYRVKCIDRDENIGYSDVSTFKTREAPKVSEVVISDIALTSAVISWKTNLICTSKIEYGATTAYGSLVYDTSESKITSHTLKLESLASGATYHYRIAGVDLYGNAVLSDDYTFATPPYPQVLSQSTDNKEEGQTEVRWTSNVPITSEVEYWSEEADLAPKTQGATPQVAEHSILLFALEDDTTYSFRLRGRDQFGNEAVSDTFTFHTLKDTTPPVLTEVYSESNVLGYGEKQKVQIIVAWKTNEPASSKVFYGEGVTGDFSGETEEFGDLVLEHLVVISDLKPSKIYHFRVESLDKARNSSTSETFTVLTSRKRDSFLQLIVGVLEDTFSWVRNIKITR